jgi:hypothetical protein
MPGTSGPIVILDANDDETAGNSMTFSGTLTLPAFVDASALPVSDPNVAGQVFVSMGALVVSSG